MEKLQEFEFDSDAIDVYEYIMARRLEDVERHRGHWRQLRLVERSKEFHCILSLGSAPGALIVFGFLGWHQYRVWETNPDGDRVAGAPQTEYAFGSIHLIQTRRGTCRAELLSNTPLLPPQAENLRRWYMLTSTEMLCVIWQRLIVGWSSSQKVFEPTAGVREIKLGGMSVITPTSIGTETQRPSSKPRRRTGIRGDTWERLEKLVRERAERIRCGKKPATKTLACELAGTEPETVRDYLPELWKRWYESDYQPDIDQLRTAL